ncbi:MAG: hypothetical protein QOJ00_2708 [Actinomycetota bacterium]
MSAETTAIQSPDLDPPEIRLLTRARPQAVQAWQVAVLAVHAALLVFALMHHERWFDEAQAWMLGRDASFKDLLLHYPRYEGSPPLWQLVLAVPAKLGAPYWTLSVISGVLAFTGAALIVIKAPFHPVIRALLPFTYWLFFQYGVISRSYALIAPILWLLAIAWPARFRRPWRMGVLALLLSLVSFHGFLIAAALMGLHALWLRRKWRELPDRVRTVHAQVLAAFGLLTLFLFFELRTPGDVSVHGGVNSNPVTALNEARGMYTGAFSNRIPILLIVAATVWWLWSRRRLLLWLTPTVAVVAFFAVRYGNVWHQGVLVEIWLFALWVSLGDQTDLQETLGHESVDRRELPRWAPQALAVGMLLVLSVQLVWTAKTIRYDYRNTYSAAAQTAAYLKTIGAPDVDIRARSVEATALQPYFDRNPFRNVNRGHCPCFWWWSMKMPFHPARTWLVRGHPAAIVYGDKWPGHTHELHRWPLPGYHVARHFHGALYIRNQVFEHEGFWVLVPDSPTSP